MRQIITEDDLKKVFGKWVVQLNQHQADFKLTESTNDGFWMEKRISFVGRVYGWDSMPHFEPKEKLIVLNGIYYNHGFFNHKEFVGYFNEGAPTYNTPEKLEKGNGRFLRLLDAEELDWLNELMKKELLR